LLIIKIFNHYYSLFTLFSLIDPLEHQRHLKRFSGCALVADGSAAFESAVARERGFRARAGEKIKESTN
jgi:hypothetical protein